MERMNPVEDRALPAYVAHADWSVERAKRQVAMARLDGDSYRVLFVRPAEQESTWGQGLRRALGVPDEEATLLAAFDFPIGLPRAYACKANIALFPTFLRKIGQEPWARFATAAGTPAEDSRCTDRSTRRAQVERAECTSAKGWASKPAS